LRSVCKDHLPLCDASSPNGLALHVPEMILEKKSYELRIIK
jgi:hypothetical protein